MGIMINDSRYLSGIIQANQIQLFHPQNWGTIDEIWQARRSSRWMSESSNYESAFS